MGYIPAVTSENMHGAGFRDLIQDPLRSNSYDGERPDGYKFSSVSLPSSPLTNLSQRTGSFVTSKVP